jgi:hypothetical protein
VNDELMERLKAADPLAGAERLSAEEQREADALLARVIAEPAPERGRAGTRRVRHLALAGVGAACAVLAGLVAVDLLDSDGPPSGIVEKAVAAVTREDAVYHFIERKRARATDLPGGPPELIQESWYTTDGGRRTKTFRRRGGRVLEDFAGRRRPGRRGGPALRYTAFENRILESGFGSGGGRSAPVLDPYSGPAATLRRYQQQGRLRYAGSEKVRGRTAYRLDSGWQPGFISRSSRDRVQFLVDAETYLPLELRYREHTEGGARRTLVSEYLVYERLPLNRRNRGLLALGRYPGAKCSPFAHELTRAELGYDNPCRRGPQ